MNNIDFKLCIAFEHNRTLVKSSQLDIKIINQKIKYISVILGKFSLLILRKFMQMMAFNFTPKLLQKQKTNSTLKYLNNLNMEEGLISQNKKNNLDQLLQNRIGYGNGQSILLRSLYVLLFSEGCETIVLGLLIPELGSQWDMNDFRKSLLITMVYLGVSLGSYLETYCDKYGRYKFLLIDAVLTSVFGLVSVFCTSYQFFLVTRFFYGIGIGIILPLTATYITEVVPGTERGRILTLSRILWSAGCLFACILGWVFLRNKQWRILLFILCLPSFYAIYDLLKYGRQSLRYVWVNKNYDEAKNIIDLLTKQNGKPEIPQEQIHRLINEDDNNQIKSQHTISEFKQLFNEKYKKQTLILCFSWVTACFVYYAVMLMLPTILARHQNFPDDFKYIFLIIISAVEVIAFYSSKFMMDHPYFGRKKSTYLLFACIFALSTILCIVGQKSMIVLLILFIGLKLFSASAFMLLYPYSAEIYETMLRSTAMGIFSLCGRIATTLLGIIGISALSWLNGMGLYYIFIIFSLASAIFIFQMPYCTLGRQLDI